MLLVVALLSTSACVFTQSRLAQNTNNYEIVLKMRLDADKAHNFFPNCERVNSDYNRTGLGKEPYSWDLVCLLT